MTIGIDCRLWNESGVGRYIRNLVKGLEEADDKNEYVLFMLGKDVEDPRIPLKFRKVVVDISWHSFEEQIILPRIFLKENLDLLHVPYINVPILYPKRFVFTIHDLIPLKYPLSKYWFKRFAYKILLSIAVKKAFKIITVSSTTKDDIISTFKVLSSKIVVACNTIDLGLNSARPKGYKTSSNNDYILYVGSAYPHKNLECLISSYEVLFDLFKKRKRPLPDLVLVGREDSFYKALLKVVPSKIAHKVRFLGFVSDEELRKLYQQALVVVLPSLCEGFGFQLLEAFASRTLVACSDIPVFHEVAGDAAIYFDPKDKRDIVEKLKRCCSMSSSDRAEFVKKGLRALKRFSMGSQLLKILEVYDESSRS